MFDKLDDLEKDASCVGECDAVNSSLAEEDGSELALSDKEGDPTDLLALSVSVAVAVREGDSVDESESVAESSSEDDLLFDRISVSVDVVEGLND